MLGPHHERDPTLLFRRDMWATLGPMPSRLTTTATSKVVCSVFFSPLGYK